MGLAVLVGGEQIYSLPLGVTMDLAPNLTHLCSPCKEKETLAIAYMMGRD